MIMENMVGKRSGPQPIKTAKQGAEMDNSEFITEV